MGQDKALAVGSVKVRSKIVKGLPFEATLPETTITREQVADTEKMSFNEINDEILAIRAERKM